MNIIDENITQDQKELLEKWGIRVKQIGNDIKSKGITDNDIISFLKEHSGILFITRDDDFYKQKYCHEKYCIVYLEVERNEVAYFIRKFLKHELFNTKAKRLGKVIKASQQFISYWQVHKKSFDKLEW